MIDQIKSKINYNPVTGKFTWVCAGKHHPDLRGADCGVLTKSRNKKYLVIQVLGKKWRAHRLAWFMTYGEIPNVIDHINGNTLDNRIVNLRNVTCLENAQNHLKQKSDFSQKKSGLPVGVKFLASGAFQARISINGKQFALGSYATPEEAHDVYMKERKSSHDCPTIK